ncbi:heat shock 70 kDa protein 12A-like [Ostrea edulis]|uniref:heat shock 70 kDa protein 12A-like n=1 Tax=Ostrea edulis TaxID=37623 RepID=UPI0024AFF80C|nr:heat shock 70 kDa protein 12A-like [Ostrea edulis]
MESIPHLFVAAIDLGTTYSGVGFSSRNSFTKDPTNVSLKSWHGTMVTSKAPTAVLFHHQKFSSFGYEAEEKYTELLLDGEAEGWNFFTKFKMTLYEQQTSLDALELESENGNKMSALTVFSAAIRYLWEQIMNEIVKQVSYVTREDIKWVITVPAIWTQPAKSFMRKAAFIAGLDSKMLTIALEPEVAAIFLKHLPLEKKMFGEIGDTFRAFSPGSKYIIVDVGGGTMDITTHEVLEDGSVKELIQSSGGDWGGTNVDDNIMEFFEDLLGSKTMSTLRTDHQLDFLELKRNIETAKLSISTQYKRKMTIIIPAVLRDLFKKHHDGMELTSVKSAKLREGKTVDISLSSGKLKLDYEIACSFFESVINSICSHLKHIFQQCSEFRVDIMIMVGGFANSSILSRGVLNEFPDKYVIVPEHAGWSVLKGAVIFGHDPQLIKERRSRYTYGVKCKQLFKDSIHDPAKRLEENGKVFCRDLFSKHVKINELITVGEYQTKKKYRISQDATSKLELYASRDPDPKYVSDEGCFKIGELKLSSPDLEVGSKSCVQLSFSQTEIEAKMVHLKTGETTVLYLETNF